MRSKFNRKDVFVGLVILVALAGILYLVTKPKTKPLVIPDSKKIEETIESKFKLTIPDDIEKADLADVSGEGLAGIATRGEILADLPDPSGKEFYQAWLKKGEELVSLGKLRVAKGGWMIEYSAAKYPDFETVLVSRETVFDSKLETRLLEGSFK